MLLFSDIRIKFEDEKDYDENRKEYLRQLPYLKKKGRFKKEASYVLCKYLPYEFEEWWNPDIFDWKNCSYDLCWYNKDKFDIWWDSSKFNWKDQSYQLPLHLSDKFNIWWDPDKYNYYGVGSADLCHYVPDKFNIWWDPNKFDWEESWALGHYVPNKFNIWWDQDKFNFFYKIVALTDPPETKKVVLSGLRSLETNLSDKRNIWLEVYNNKMKSYNNKKCK